jgi:hypothetical protein
MKNDIRHLLQPHDGIEDVNAKPRLVAAEAKTAQCRVLPPHLVWYLGRAHAASLSPPELKITRAQLLTKRCD